MNWSSITDAMRRTTQIWRVFYSKWFGAALILCLLIGTVLWFFRQEKLPRTIRIATGAKHGQYYLYGDVLASSMEQAIGSDVAVKAITTRGSVDNLKRLASGDADLAIVQHGAVPMTGLAVIAPLFEDVVHVIVRKGRGIESIGDLAGKNVVLGSKGSGMRASAIEILDHYGVKPDTLGNKTTSYFLDLADDETLDAAVVTTGYANADLKRLLAGGPFELLPVDAAEALSIRYAHFVPATIPHSLYSEGPAVPDRPIKTVATTAILVASSKAPAPLIQQAVIALYEVYPHSEASHSKRRLPRLMNASDARQWTQLPLHPVTETYFEPYKSLVLLKDFMESIVATKELMFTLGAGFYVLWLWRRKIRTQRSAAELAVYMRRLNSFLDETIQIESEQMRTDDPKQLREYLDEVTRIKLRALDALTDENLRGDQMFAIFLAQCSNLSRKLQLKISLPLDPQTR